MPKRYLHKEIIKYSGIFDLQGLYRLIADWLRDRGYEVHEVKVKHKVPTPAGAEQEIKWEAWINETDYLRFWIYVHFFFYDMKDVEVVKNGVKKQLTKTRILIELNCMLETDWQKRWESSRFLKHLQNFYEKYIIRKELDTLLEDKIYYITLKLHTAIKEYLEMETRSDAFHDVW